MKENYKSIVKSFLIFLLFTLTFKESVQAQATATTLQSTITGTMPGDTNVPVVIVRINVTIMPYNLYALFLSTSGSTNAGADITNAKVFYTGNSNSFSTSTQFSSTVSSPNGFFSIGPDPNFPLLAGDNYFWVTYDVQSAAIACDTLDASCSTVYGSNGTMTPAVTDPAGSAIIGFCTTNIENISNDTICFVYPNPSTNEFTIQNNSAQLLHFSLYNSLGEKLIDKTLANKTSTINISAFASDIYFYRVRNDEQVIKSGKIIKP